MVIDADADGVLSSTYQDPQLTYFLHTLHIPSHCAYYPQPHMPIPIILLQ